MATTCSKQASLPANIKLFQDLDDLKSRQGKVRAFKGQAVTAGTCLVFRVVLLFHYARFFYIARGRLSVEKLDLEDLAPLTFLSMETAFSRKFDLVLET